MKIVLMTVVQLMLLSSAYAGYRSYEAEKEEYRRFDEGGAVVAPGWGGGVELAPDRADPAYDSTVDEDMLFDSYHNKN
jgi:hypothetical protein